MSFKLRSGNKTTFKEMGSSSLKQTEKKDSGNVMTHNELKESLGVTDLPMENYEAYLRNRGANIVPAAEISTLSDESNDKLSDSQKQVYDAFGGRQTAEYKNEFVPGGRTINPVRREGTLHWEDALQMVEDSGVENVHNTPQQTRDIYGKHRDKHPMDEFGNFRPHAGIPYDSGGDIFIPSIDAHRKQYKAWNDQGAFGSDEEIDERSLNRYVGNLTAELGHLVQRDIENENVEGGGYRGAAERASASRDARAELEGRKPDRSNYSMPEDYEMQTHYGSKGGEYTLFDKYNSDARMRRMYPSLFRKKKK